MFLRLTSKPLNYCLGKDSPMDYLQKILWKLPDVWKDYFGLYTQYIGYLSPQMVKTLLQVKRNIDNELDVCLKDMDLKQTNEYAIKHGFNELPYKKEIDDVLPRMWEYLNQYDLSDDTVPTEQWDEMIEYLDSKAAKERVLCRAFIPKRTMKTLS